MQKLMIIAITWRKLWRREEGNYNKVYFEIADPENKEKSIHFWWSNVQINYENHIAKDNLIMSL